MCHRVDPRFIYNTLHDHLGVALTLGYDKSALGETIEIASTRLAPRAWFERRFEGRAASST